MISFVTFLFSKNWTTEKDKAEHTMYGLKCIVLFWEAKMCFEVFLDGRVTL